MNLVILNNSRACAANFLGEGQINEAIYKGLLANLCHLQSLFGRAERVRVSRPLSFAQQTYRNLHGKLYRIATGSISHTAGVYRAVLALHFKSGAGVPPSLIREANISHYRKAIYRTALAVYRTPQVYIAQCAALPKIFPPRFVEVAEPYNALRSNATTRQ